jgi:ParB/RepB/Spo0J family partition protein
MDETKENKGKNSNKEKGKDEGQSKLKTRQGSGYLKQLYSTARTTAGQTHSHLRNLTTILVNFVPVDKVDTSEHQVRSHFDDEEIAGLAQSIKQHGVLQPILVIQNGDRYKAIAGERRLRASRVAGIDRIPARVLATDDKATQEIALRENLDRVDLHPLEEGEGYISLLEVQAYTSHDALAKAFGKPKSRITECIGFTRLPNATKNELLRTGLKNRSLLRQLLSLPEAKHLSLIKDVLGKEETLQVSPLNRAPASGPEGRKKIAPKPFKFKVDRRSVRVTGFKWKRTDGPEALRAYLDSLKRLLSEAELLI